MVQYCPKNCQILDNFLVDFLPKNVQKSEKLFLIIQNASIRKYRCHAIKYSCPKKLVWKSFLDTILQSRSLCRTVEYVICMFWCGRALNSILGNYRSFGKTCSFAFRNWFYEFDIELSYKFDTGCCETSVKNQTYSNKHQKC